MILLHHLLVITCCVAASMTYSVDVAANKKDEIYDLEETEHDDATKRQANSVCP